MMVMAVTDGCNRGDGYSGADGLRVLVPGALTKGPRLFVRTLQGCRCGLSSSSLT